MSSHVFKIGDRFRIVEALDEFSIFHGKEGVIYGVSRTRQWLIDVDGYGRIWHDGTALSANSSALEPILPKSQIHEILAMKDLPNRDCKIARVGEVANV